MKRKDDGSYPSVEEEERTRCAEKVKKRFVAGRVSSNRTWMGPGLEPVGRRKRCREVPWSGAAALRGEGAGAGAGVGAGAGAGACAVCYSVSVLRLPLLPGPALEEEDVRPVTNCWSQNS